MSTVLNARTSSSRRIRQLYSTVCVLFVFAYCDNLLTITAETEAASWRYRKGFRLSVGCVRHNCTSNCPYIYNIYYTHAVFLQSASYQRRESCILGAVRNGYTPIYSRAVQSSSRFTLVSLFSR